MAKAAVGKSKEESPSKPSVMSALVGIVIATLLAAGGGVGFALYVLKKPSNESAIVAAGAPAPAALSDVQVKELAPIITNIASPKNAWVRLEAAIVVDKDVGPQLAVLSAKTSEDLLAFLKTVSLAQIEGASAFMHLREDLNDRVRLRSEGKIRELIIIGFIIE